MLSQGSYDSARGGAVDSSGNLYVCGQSDSSGFVVKYNSSGTVGSVHLVVHRQIMQKD